ncbi:hypothetical protein [Coleofasciculus sp. F4-SAH-05]|uniref:hypothetical protein n=1 Tax=Coleofasciculus sp. F4-SAH-05 TaxID=3069525 RepID=UPI0032F2E021
MSFLVMNYWGLGLCHRWFNDAQISGCHPRSKGIIVSRYLANQHYSCRHKVIKLGLSLTAETPRTNHKPSAFCLLLYLEFGNKDGHGKLAAEQTAFTVSYG